MPARLASVGMVRICESRRKGKDRTEEVGTGGGEWIMQFPKVLKSSLDVFLRRVRIFNRRMTWHNLCNKDHTSIKHGGTVGLKDGGREASQKAVSWICSFQRLTFLETFCFVSGQHYFYVQRGGS